MFKKTLIIFFVIAVLLLGGYFYDSVEAPLVTTENRNCNIDSDCVQFIIGCDGCKLDVVNKSLLDEMISKVKDYCSDNPPRYVCEPNFGNAKCIDDSCTLVR